MTVRKKTSDKMHSQKSSGNNDNAQPSESFPVIGIGASAGGLEALEIFFAHVDPQCGMAFIVIQHLDPTHKSIMGSLLKKYTSMEISEIADGEMIMVNRIYLAPPDHSVTSVNKTLHLVASEKSHGISLPIDVFFQSLAKDQGDQSIGIILSGTGSDGTLGIKAIKAAGGMAMVQTEEQAKYSGMPKSALDTGLVDFVLPVEEMANQISLYTQHPYLQATELHKSTEDEFQTITQKIITLLCSKTGHDFSLYKQSTIRRRIERRMALHQIEKITDYFHYLERNTNEIDLLFKELLINVTRFFRDPEAFDALEKEAFPIIFERKEQDQPLRVWVPGCSSGEEAYSLVILLTEVMEKQKKHFPLQVFASDIDTEAIETARRATYPESISEDVSKMRLSRFFTKEGNAYRVKKQVRDCVIFALQDLAKDPPFSQLDLVSCRNLLIYMDHTLQKKIFPIFQYSLVDRGILFLGNSESIGEFTGSFSPIDTKWKIYKRRGISHSPIEYPRFPKRLPTIAQDKTTPTARSGFKTLGEKVIAQSFAPPSVLINENFDVLYSYGSIDHYLAISSGEASLNLLHIAREGLRHRLGPVLAQALKDRVPVVNEDVHVRSESGMKTIDLIVQPIIEPGETQVMMMVVFKEKSESRTPAPKTKKSSNEPTSRDAEIDALEQELKTTKEYLQNTIEELQTANEEFQSTNEELQSTNEELETSKEELQSTNEELITVNSELQHKVEQLTETGNDISNLLASTDIASIFLDNDLRIKRFTPSMANIFRLLEADTGRSIRDITSTIISFNIYDAAEQVLSSLIRKEVEVRNDFNNWFSLRILPYRTIDNTIDGVVITFVDISELKRASQELEETKLLAENIVETIREPFIVIDKDLSVRSASNSFYERFKVKPKDTINRQIYELGDGQWNIPQLRTLLDEIIPANTKVVDYRVEHEFSGLGRRVMMLNARSIPRTKLILLVIEDITESNS
jgi:two-component system CheB/CheR fusion protein